MFDNALKNLGCLICEICKLIKKTDTAKVANIRVFRDFAGGRSNCHLKTKMDTVSKCRFSVFWKKI